MHVIEVLSECLSACSVKWTDEKKEFKDTILHILPHRNTKDRDAIREDYQQKYNSVRLFECFFMFGGTNQITLKIWFINLMWYFSPKDLAKDVSHKLKQQQPAFKHAMTALAMSPAQYDAQTLHDAMKGLGTDESKLDEILITRNKQVGSHFIPVRAAFYQQSYSLKMLLYI